MDVPLITFAARRLRAVFISACSIAAALAIFSVPAAANPKSADAAPAGKTLAAKPPAPTKPLWSELTPSQQQALAPLASEWDKLDAFRKNKWLTIGNRYASMKPDEQHRVQERMRDWVRLTPEQRRIARESYARTKKLNPDQKSEQWKKYQQLPEEQKKKLAADAASKKHVATLPSPTALGKHSKTLPPIKAATKKRLPKQSTNPSAAAPSNPPPPPPPAH